MNTPYFLDLADPTLTKQLNTEITHGAIGIFDSGVGGLSIAKCIATHLPNENLIYFADHRYAPYGDKTQTEIIERVNMVSDILIKLGAKTLVLACNTATVNAIDQLRMRYQQQELNTDDHARPLPIIGVEPAIKPATQLSKNQKVGILATSATAANKRFIELVQRHKNGCQVTIQACPGLVELIEQGLLASPQCKQLLRQYLQPLITQQIDTLVLGCTHYPFLTEHIKEIVGNAITVVDTAQPVTEQLARQLNRYDLCAPSARTGSHYFISSDLTSDTKQLIRSLWCSNS